MTALEYCNEYSMLNLIREMYLTVFGQSDAMQTIMDWISGKEGVLSNFGSIIDSAGSFIQICIGIGILFTLIYYAYDLITDKMGPGQELTPEILITSFVKLLIVFIIIVNMITFVEGIFNISTAIFANANNALNSSPTGQMAIENMVDQYVVELGQGCDDFVEGFPKILEGLGKFIANITVFTEIINKILMLIAWLVSWVCTGLVFFAVYSRQAELIIRAIFAPVSLSDLYLGGVRSRGFEYLKSFAAICFQSIVMIAVFWVTNQITIAILDPSVFLNGVSSLKDITNSQIVLVVVAKLVQAAMIMKSGQLAKEIFATH